MRELTFVEIGYICVGLALCLVMPLMVSALAPKNPVTRNNCVRAVWIGQFILALAGLGILASSSLAPYAGAAGLMLWSACAVALARQFRAADSARTHGTA